MSPRIVRFQWDDANIAHIARHAVSPKEVEEGFLDSQSFLVDIEQRRGERRYEMIGETKAGRVLTIIFIIRSGAVRPVTAHTAARKDTAKYLSRRK